MPEEETETFECPICQTIVSSNAESCPECGAIFEMEKRITSPIMDEKIQGPSPPPKEEEPPVPIPSYLQSTGPRPPEMEPSPDLLEEEEIIVEHKEAFPPPVEDMPPPPELEETELEEPEPELPPPEAPREFPAEQRVTTALLDYTRRRKKRYMSGALFLGIGLVLFVLLWLVAVYETLVIETTDLFLIEALLILVGAAIFFILGLYLILSYPKSSLIDVFGSLMQNRQMEEPAEQ